MRLAAAIIAAIISLALPEWVAGIDAPRPLLPLLWLEPELDELPELCEPLARLPDFWPPLFAAPDAPLPDDRASAAAALPESALPPSTAEAAAEPCDAVARSAAATP